MNKKFLLAMALPAVLVGCSQEDLVTEGVVSAPAAKAIDNVTFTIAKETPALGGIESRADWVNNKIKFEKTDKVSLYWLGDDGLTQNTDGTFSGQGSAKGQQIAGTLSSGALIGNSNAVFRTEDGSKFTAEAVVYEGYNLLVYPANVAHTTAKNIVVSLPAIQKATDDFAENAIYIGDSILHIHQPALNVNNGKYYNIYGHQATTEDPNTSGYAHGVSTGVKLLTSLLNMDLRIVNAPANDVKINKIVLTTENKVAGKFNVSGNLINTGTVTNPIEYVAAAGSKAQFTNPWFASKNDGMTDGVTLSFDGVNTNVNGSTKGTMLLLPTNLNVNSLGTGEQPVLKVYTNYGIVTIGGSVADNDAQTNAIYKKDGIEKAAVNDNQALVDIIDNATNYVDKSLKVYRQDVTNKKQDYSINSGVSMTRVIKVDMAKAVMEGMEASTTEELNAILKAAVKNPNNKFTSSNKLEVKLIPNNLGQFTLTNYEGLDAFVTKFDLGALTLSQGNSKGNGAQLSTVVMNTTSVTVLKDVEGLADAVSLTIPATSAITSVKNGVSYAQHTITNPIVNKKTITLAQYSNVTIKDNTSGEFIYTRGASMDVTSIDTKAKYGKIYYKADTYNHMMEAADAGVNYIEVANVTNAFFNGIVDLSSSSNEANGTGLGGITVEFNNCGDLASTIEEGIKTQSIVLTNGTTYTNVYYAVVKEVTVKSANAKLGMGATNVNNKTYFDKITIAEGTTIIEQINVPTLEVKSGATATITSDCLAPTNLTVWGTASFAGSNGQTDQKVFVDANYNGKIDGINAITGTCIVTGSLELKNNLAYENVAVSATTNITVATGVKGLGYTEIINVTKAGQETATANLFTYHKDEVPAASMPTRYSWDGVATSTLQWN